MVYLAVRNAGEPFDVIDKQVKTTADAVAGVRDGSTVLVAGFGAVGVADNLLDALHEQGARELTIVANNSGNGDYGLARLIDFRPGAQGDLLLSAVRRLQRLPQRLPGQSLELELLPQGTISERMRCHAAGLGGFFSPVSAGTKLGEGKETREIDRPAAGVRKASEGRRRADQGQQGRPLGQPHLHQVGAEFSNPVMAMAAELTVVEVDQDDIGDWAEMRCRSRGRPEHLCRPRGRCRRQLDFP